MWNTSVNLFVRYSAPNTSCSFLCPSCCEFSCAFSYTQVGLASRGLEMSFSSPPRPHMFLENSHGMDPSFSSYALLR